MSEILLENLLTVLLVTVDFDNLYTLYYWFIIGSPIVCIQHILLITFTIYMLIKCVINYRQALISAIIKYCYVTKVRTSQGNIVTRLSCYLMSYYKWIFYDNPNWNLNLCLKSELLWVWISDTFWKKCLIRTVWKPNSFWVFEIYTDFIH